MCPAQYVSCHPHWSHDNMHMLSMWLLPPMCAPRTGNVVDAKVAPLFQPFKVGSHQLANRMVSADGCVTRDSWGLLKRAVGRAAGREHSEWVDISLRNSPQLLAHSRVADYAACAGDAAPHPHAWHHG
jgi:hypothetical protein